MRAEQVTWGFVNKLIHYSLILSSRANLRAEIKSFPKKSDIIKITRRKLLELSYKENYQFKNRDILEAILIDDQIRMKIANDLLQERFGFIIDEHLYIEYLFSKLIINMLDGEENDVFHYYGIKWNSHNKIDILVFDEARFTLSILETA